MDKKDDGKKKRGFTGFLKDVSGIDLSGGDDNKGKAIPTEEATQSLPAGQNVSKRAPIITSMSAMEAASDDQPTRVYTDDQRSKKYYNVFIEEVKPIGQPYFLFLTALESMREFITDEDQLVKAAIKSLKTQNGIGVEQVIAAITDMLSQVEATKNNEIKIIDKDDLVKNASIQGQLNATVQQISDLKEQLEQACAQEEKLKTDLDMRRKDGQQRKTCLESASRQLSAELTSVKNKIVK